MTYEVKVRGYFNPLPRCGLSQPHVMLADSCISQCIVITNLLGKCRYCVFNTQFIYNSSQRGGTCWNP